METGMLFGEWLSHQIYMRQWDQKMLAHMSGVTAAQISRIISGTRRPGPESLTGIAAALKVPPEDLFRRAGLLPMPASATTDDRRLMQDLIRKIERFSPEDRRYAAELLDRVFPNVQK